MSKRKGSVTPFRGKWRAYVGREYLGVFDTEQEGWDACEAWNDVEANAAPDSLRIFGGKWLELRERTVRGSKSERSRWDMHIATSKFADWALRRIRARDVDAWVRALLRKSSTQITNVRAGIRRGRTMRTLSRQSVVHCRNLLSLCLDHAVLEGKLAANPCDVVKVPRIDEVVEDHEAWAYLFPEEIAQLFAAIEKAERRDFYRALYAVAVYGGLRKGEVLGLRWDNITLEGPRPELRVRFSYNGPPKTKVSRRTVPLLQPLRAALERWRRSGGVVRATGLVFPNPKGGCYGLSYDAAWEVRWRAAAGIRAHVRFHDLRHTCASHLIMGTWTAKALSIYQVKEWLGHADLKTTARYAHLGNLHEAIKDQPSSPWASDKPRET